MIEAGFLGLVAVPAGLGLIGFVEPCSLGSSLVFVKYLEGKGATAKLLEVTLFAVTRSAFIGLLGVVAALLGALFLDRSEESRVGKAWVRTCISRWWPSPNKKR